MTSVRKATRPPRRWEQAAVTATSPDDRLTVAYDRLRRDLVSLRRKRRDPLERATDAATADRLAGDAAGYLTRLCEQAEGADRQ